MKILSRLLLFVLLFQALLAGCGTRRPAIKKATLQDAEYIDAQEFKLKIRELADQMLSTTPNSGLADVVALPTSFVDLDNKRQTSPLGNLIAESLIYEFNQRSFPVCEYRLSGNIDMTFNQGDFALLRQGVYSTVGKKWAALIVGTYYRDKDAVFVNARLVRAHDGMVLRTAQLVLLNNALAKRLLEPPPSPVVASVAAPAPPLPASPTAGRVVPKPTPAKANTQGLVTSGSMNIVPAPWKSTPPKGAAGPGIKGNSL